MVQPDKSLGLSEIKLSASSIKHTPSLNDSPYNFNKNNRSVIRNTLNGSPATSSNVNGLSSSASQQYKIHVIKTDHIYENSCYFCKEDFIHSKRSFSKRICKGKFFITQDAPSTNRLCYYNRHSLETFAIISLLLLIGSRLSLNSKNSQKIRAMISAYNQLNQGKTF